MAGCISVGSYGWKLRQYTFYSTLARYFLFTRGKVYQVVGLRGAAQCQEYLQQADHACSGIIAAQSVKLPVALQYRFEGVFPPSVDGFHGIDVGIQQQSRFLKVEHRAEAPHIVAFAPRRHALHFDMVLQVICRFLLIAAQGRNGYE